MPQFKYRGRDKTGTLRTGERSATTADALNVELSREGIFPIEIKEIITTVNFLDKLKSMLQSETMHLEEMAIFSKQMQLLTKSGVPIIPALHQLSSFTRSHKLSKALNGVADNLEKGKSLASSLVLYPNVFPPLVVNIVSIGESTGHLSDAFLHLFKYLDFEVRNRKMLKATFRYPMFVLIAVFLVILILNLFVIPTFARFYSGLTVALPWQTRFLIGMSTIFTRYGFIILAVLIGMIFLFLRYIKTPSGEVKFSHFLLRAPIFGKLYRRLILIRFSQSLAITLNSGLSITQGLTLVKNSLHNKYIENQIHAAQELIERGTSFTQAMSTIELFTPMEQQIIYVGEKNGELGDSMNYIGTFQSSEIEFDMKRLNDNVGPILIALISGLVLIVALGIYLPVWNMISLVR